MSADPVILDDASYEALKQAPEAEIKRYLFVEPHPSLKRFWKVSSFDATYRNRLGDEMGRFDNVSPLAWDGFAARAAEQGYEIIFMDNPSEDLAWVDAINADPEVEINSSFPKTIRGFLPFQAQGVNFAMQSDRGCYLNWSTGTGKTVGCEGIILRSKLERPFDICIYCVKPNNLVNARRKLKEHTGLDATILSGTPKRRQRLFGEIASQMVNEETPILICNYEKFREDKDFFKLLIEGHRVLYIFDEMPTKLAHRGTALYKAVTECMYTSFMQRDKTKPKTYYPKAGEERASQHFAVALSATPMDVPNDFFSCVRLLDPTVYGSVTNFEKLFVAEKDPWHNVVAWRNLDLMGAMAAHIVHQADKENDPEIKAQFPEVVQDDEFIELDDADRKLYDLLQAEYNTDAIKDGDSILDMQEILAAITVLQMTCLNPRSVLASAQLYDEYLVMSDLYEKELRAKGANEDEIKTSLAVYAEKYKEGSKVAKKFRMLVGDDSKFTDADKKGELRCAKLQSLVDYIRDNDSKVVVFTRFAKTVLPLISEWLTRFEIEHVVYTGEMSMNAKQKAQDAFRTDPAIKVFLGSDAGSDSIDLPEANLVLHYDLPWTFSKVVQRENRTHRIDSTHEKVRFVRLATPDTVEDRVAEIVEMKKGMAAQVLKGEIADQAFQLRKSDFLYILTGERVAVADDAYVIEEAA